MKEKYSEGTITAKTRCWAQGMDGWRPLYTIPQLKWCLVASSQAVQNETDMAILILNMLNKLVPPSCLPVLIVLIYVYIM